MEHGSSTKRIELNGGRWAELRALTAGDLREQRMNAHQRGFEDAVLDGLFLVPRLVSAWSYGDVSQATLDAVSLDDVTTLLGHVNRPDDDSPNGSSSDGDVTASDRPLTSGSSE